MVPEIMVLIECLIHQLSERNQVLSLNIKALDIGEGVGHIHWRFRHTHHKTTDWVYGLKAGAMDKYHIHYIAFKSNL